MNYRTREIKVEKERRLNWPNSQVGVEVAKDPRAVRFFTAPSFILRVMAAATCCPENNFLHITCTSLKKKKKLFEANEKGKQSLSSRNNKGDENTPRITKGDRMLKA